MVTPVSDEAAAKRLRTGGEGPPEVAVPVPATALAGAAAPVANPPAASATTVASPVPTNNTVGGAGVVSAGASPSGTGASQTLESHGSNAEGSGPECGTVPEELPALKVTFYELLIRQLRDDGFAAEAQSVAQQLHLQHNSCVEKDALFGTYSKSLKWAFTEEPPPGEWVPIDCSPVPPLGPQEKVLDLDSPAASGAVSKAPVAGTSPITPLPISTLDQQPVVQGLGRRAPEIRLLYTSQHQQSCPCRAAAFSSDGRSCAAGFLDGSIKLLDCARMRACAVSTEGPLARMRVTEEELTKPVTRVLHDHVLGITCLAFHPTNPTLFSGSLDKAVKIFDLTRPPGHKRAFSVLQDVHTVRCISIHPCGDFLLVGTAHQAVRYYDLQTLNCFTTFNQSDHHGSGVNDVRCTSDGRLFASASSDGAIHIWDAISHRIVNRLPKAHSASAVTSVRWSRNLRYLLSSGADGRHRLWDVRKGREIFCMGFGTRACDWSRAVFCAGERYIASSTSNTRLSDVSLFDSQTGSPVFMKLGMHTLPVHALEASPIDRTLITGCDDHKARYFSVEDRGGG